MTHTKWPFLLMLLKRKQFLPDISETRFSICKVTLDYLVRIGCVVNTVQCKVGSAQYEVCSMQCTVSIDQCALISIQWTVHSL